MARNYGSEKRRRERDKKRRREEKRARLRERRVGQPDGEEDPSTEAGEDEAGEQPPPTENAGPDTEESDSAR